MCSVSSLLLSKSWKQIGPVTTQRRADAAHQASTNRGAVGTICPVLELQGWFLQDSGWLCVLAVGADHAGCSMQHSACRHVVHEDVLSVGRCMWLHRQPYRC